jgi:hypothetical protein
VTPVQKIRYLILAAVARNNESEVPVDLSGEAVDDMFHALDEDEIQEAQYEVREGQFETGLKCDWSRHYESKSVAAKTPSGEWVGWTYWYGGGKHGEPEAIDWIESAYDLKCTEEEKMVTVRTWEPA